VTCPYRVTVPANRERYRRFRSLDSSPSMRSWAAPVSAELSDYERFAEGLLDTLSTLFINSADGSVALIQCPNRTCASGEKARLRSHRYRRQHLSRTGVHRRHDIAFDSGDPDRSVAEHRIKRTGRNVNSVSYTVRGRIDSDSLLSRLTGEPTSRR
jgi:hypothetical protein